MIHNNMGDLLDESAIERGYNGHLIKCPICRYDYCHAQNAYKTSNENIGGAIRFEGECGHTFYLVAEFHKGQTFLYFYTFDKVDYKEYINSGEWRKKADEAKERAGFKCQVCNRPASESLTLDAHHRTYDRLGKELPEDITVLCRECHELYEKNKIKKNGKVIHVGQD